MIPPRLTVRSPHCRLLAWIKVHAPEATNTNRSHEADEPSECAVWVAEALRIAAGYRVHDLDEMRSALRAAAGRLYPRPGVVDFPAEETTAPTRQSGGAA